MSGSLTLLKRELKSVTKEKTIMVAIIIQFFVASFSSVLLIGIMSFYDPESIGHSTQVRVDVGVVGNTDSPLLGFLKGKNLTVVYFYDVDDAEDAFRSGRVDTVIFIPESNNGVVDIKLVLPELDAMQTVILMLLQEPLERYENYLREINGVELRYKDLGGEPHTTYEFLYSLIIPILMLFPAFIAGSIVVDAVAEEFENKTFDTLQSAPVSVNGVFASKVLAAVIISALQCIMWAVLLRLNGLFIQNVGFVLLLSVIVAAFISIGAAIIALYFKDRERAQFTYSIVLIAAAGLSYFIDPSPFSLITRLATGDYYTTGYEVALYAIPLLIIGILCFTVSRKLLATKS